MRARVSTRQRGFTLVEIAIVLVIIGLLLGGILKGQEMINNSRVKAAANDFNGIAAAYNSYVDRYHRIPGDDNNGGAGVASRGGLWIGVPSGNGDGMLGTAPNIYLQSTATFTTAGSPEGGYFWQHLRAAGLLTGNPLDTGVNAVPTNVFGGRIGIAADGTQGRANGVVMLCMGSVPGALARALDVQLDDGNDQTGTVRATTDNGTGNTPPGALPGANYIEDQLYTVCRDLT